MSLARKAQPKPPNPREGEFDSWRPKPGGAQLRMTDTRARLTVPLPKTKAVRSEAYLRLVAELPCAICGVVGYSQAAHPNTGKAMGGKTDDRLCFPLCCARPGIPGCHALFDQGAMLTKEKRRALEPFLGQRTREAINASGRWPTKLPAWGDE